MFNHKSTKSAIIMVAAVLMVVAVLLTACNGNAFKPVEMPELGKTPVSNGGNAVRYGDWIYYVNGYQSSASAENTYEKIDARVASIARIKISVIEELFGVLEDTSTFTTSTARTNEIKRLVAENAQIVVPKFYYSGNTTSTQINGIYIFNDRLYMLTPNDALTAGGNAQTSQSVLTSFGLDGSNEQRHYVFTNNAAQIMLSEAGDKLVATYIMDNVVGCIDVKTGEEIAKVEETSSAQIDVAGKTVFYINKDKAICRLDVGAAEESVVVANEEDSTVTFTISNVNNGYVYYTKADSTNGSVDAKRVYCKGTSGDEAIAFKSTAPSENWYGYEGGIVKVVSDSVDGINLYGIRVINSDGTVKKQVVDPVTNDTSITFNRIEGSKLYYTSNSIAYVVDLAGNDKPVAIGNNMYTANGWSVPDVIEMDGESYNYVIALGSGSVSAYKFDSATKEKTDSVTLTIVEPEEEE